MGHISDFIDTYFRHFNSATVVESAKSYKKHIDQGGKMLVTLSGAMSTAEIGRILAEMIRQDKVHCISCTGANLEEDIMNLVSYSKYKDILNYKELSPSDESELYEKKHCRVLDRCIPLEDFWEKFGKHLYEIWQKTNKEKKSYFPHEYFYQLLKEEKVKNYYDIDPKDSWVFAASEKNLPLVVPGWEDSYLGNALALGCMEGDLNAGIVKTGVEYMVEFANWYQSISEKHSMGFFQIGGGIAGDFPICVAPLLKSCRWSYFCQISDSITSYGSYSGASPNEKISWGKLDINTPRYAIESDATIVAPLIFAYVLGL